MQRATTKDKNKKSKNFDKNCDAIGIEWYTVKYIEHDVMYNRIITKLLMMTLSNEL